MMFLHLKKGWEQHYIKVLHVFFVGHSPMSSDGKHDDAPSFLPQSRLKRKHPEVGWGMNTLSRGR